MAVGQDNDEDGEELGVVQRTRARDPPGVHSKSIAHGYFPIQTPISQYPRFGRFGPRPRLRCYRAEQPSSLILTSAFSRFRTK